MCGSVLKNKTGVAQDILIDTICLAYSWVLYCLFSRVPAHFECFVADNYYLPATSNGLNEEPALYS